MNEPNFGLLLAFCGAVVTFAIVGAWWVLRPFERYRRELKRARRQAAE